MRRLLAACALLAATSLVAIAVAAEPQHATPTLQQYHARTGHPDAWQGGVRMIPIHTPHGDFRVSTKRVGNNPRIKL